MYAALVVDVGDRLVPTAPARPVVRAISVLVVFVVRLHARRPVIRARPVFANRFACRQLVALLLVEVVRLFPVRASSPVGTAQRAKNTTQHWLAAYVKSMALALIRRHMNTAIDCLLRRQSFVAALAVGRILLVNSTL